ncbi:Ger(x)C family spore germination protein [Paenibacillus sp. SC116]|uniref:Ger(x)C family spore germination protein n=1 Tax=Paenibacillus sp. SC116 TaxID=2968986 RepID=UPI00215A708B|nr:Ger(x)C family spore germination protein [Paenibacillus sp. SC116]MCR8842169.1 Ger(x)C family spore germination protein [Paenibacillus sp. SC116]
MLWDRRFAAYALFCLCLLTLLPSCSSDIRELNQVSIVMATGIDWDKDTNKHRITVYTLQPTSKGTNATQQDSLNEWFGSATGDSIMESAQHLRYRASKKLFWFHNRIFIISRDAARHSLPEIIDFLQRNREIRSTSLVLISDVNADQILKTKPETQDLVVNELFGMIRNQDETGNSLGISVKDLINKNANTTQGYITGRVVTRTPREKSEPVLALHGSALLQKGTFVNWLSSDETAIVRLLTDPDKDKVQATFVVKDQDYDFDSITAQVAIKSRKIRSYFVGDQPEMDIHFDFTCMINELKHNQTANQMNIPTLENIIKKTIQQDIQSVITTAQSKVNVDYLGFGNHIYQHHPDRWKQIQPKWNDVFKKMPVHVTVNLTIWNTGNVQ